MVRYKMVGLDTDSFPAQYRTWVVNDNPDLSGQLYTGLKSGSTPLEDIVAYAIQNDGYVVDFNLPVPTSWKPVLGTLPAHVADSHFAILDGYGYLFGGTNSRRIFQMDLNRPAEWWDTEAVLPSALSGSCFAIIGDTMYLFGGTGADDSAFDTIYSAPVSDPLNWTNTGTTLPERIRKQQLAIVDGYVYLFGGLGVNDASNVIWRAPVTNPLAWEDTGSTLPVALFGSQIAIMMGSLYLLGGLTDDNQTLDVILSANLSDPVTWTTESETLPWPCYGGQFLTVGYYGYLYTQAGVTGSQPYLTRILRCATTAPGSWIDTQVVLPGDIHESQFGIIDDRIWAFGGNGLTALYTCDQIMKYNPSHEKVLAYGQITRTEFNAETDPAVKNQILGFPYWKTNYGS